MAALALTTLIGPFTYIRVARDALTHYNRNVYGNHRMVLDTSALVWTWEPGNEILETISA